MKDKSLRNYVEIGKLFGKSDLEIIRMYLIDNDLEEQGINMISQLAKSKIEKLDMRIRASQFIYDSSLMGLEMLLKKYSRKNALFLYELEHHFASSFSLPDKLVEEAREIIPTLNMPQWYYLDLVTYLWLEHQILFKDDDPKKREQYLNDYSRLRGTNNE